MIHSSLQTMILELMETMIYLVIRVTGLSSEEKLVLKKKAFYLTQKQLTKLF